MKTFFKIILGLIALAGVAGVAVVLLTSGARDTARNFVLQATSGQITQAHGLLHQELRRQVPLTQLDQMFAGAEPYADVSFSSVEASGGNTTLKGTARTAGGCSSQVAFQMLDDSIISFDITPLCRK